MKVKVKKFASKSTKIDLRNDKELSAQYPWLGTTNVNAQVSLPKFTTKEDLDKELLIYQKLVDKNYDIYSDSPEFKVMKSICPEAVSMLIEADNEDYPYGFLPIKGVKHPTIFGSDLQPKYYNLKEAK